MSDDLDAAFGNLRISPHRKWKDVFDQRNLLKYSKKIGKKWRDVGIQLGISQAELDNFEMDNSINISNAILAMLNSFRNSSPRYGSVEQMEELAEAFQAAGLMELACDVTGANAGGDPVRSPEPTSFPQQETMPPGVNSISSKSHSSGKSHSPQPQSRTQYPSVRMWEDSKMYDKLTRDTKGVYKMNARPRGLALIINIDKAAGFNRRGGSEVDQRLMENLFKGLGFEVMSRKDLTDENIREELSNLSNPKHADMKKKIKAADCIVTVIMSHGQKDEIFTSDGRVIRCEDVLSFFQEKKSQDLYGKPVLLFIQACRGGLVDRGQTQADDATSLEDEEGDQSNTYAQSTNFVNNMIRPETADILIAYSSVSGYKSYRNTSEGSWFVREVAHVFSDFAKEEHVEELMIRVRQAVTENSPSTKSKGFQAPDRQPELYKQCPETVSRLTKKLYFFPGK